MADGHENPTTYGEVMSEKNTARSVLDSPWSQAIAGGTLTLVPGRKYPAWLRHTLTWGSTATVVGLIAIPGLGSKVLKGASGQESVQTVEMSPRVRAGYATVAGASMYGMWRFGWWFDEASEQALRKLHVPFPRVVLGGAVGALYYFGDNRGQRERPTPERFSLSGGRISRQIRLPEALSVLHCWT